MKFMLYPKALACSRRGLSSRAGGVPTRGHCCRGSARFPAAVNPSARWRWQSQSLSPYIASILGLFRATDWVCLRQLGTEPFHPSPSLTLTPAHLNLSSESAGTEPKFSCCPAVISGRTEPAGAGANSISVTTQTPRALRRGGGSWLGGVSLAFLSPLTGYLAAGTRT